MITNNHALYSVKVFFGILAEFIIFPIWWYSRGLFIVLKSVFFYIQGQEKSMALFVWMKNLFVPMYGEYNWQGFLISFFIRLTQIIIRSIVMIVWVILGLLLILIWIVLPFLVVGEIFIQIT